MAKKTFEVRVEGTSVEFYEVLAENEEDALSKWATGTLSAYETVAPVPVSATPYFEDEDYEEDE